MILPGRTFIDAEGLVKDWVLSTSVAALVTHNNYIHVYLSMPKGSPLPAITLARVGGGIDASSDVPVDYPRISFQCWAKSRPQALNLARVLASEAESLGLTGGYTSVAIGGGLYVAEMRTWLWLPDPVSDTPRYVVDFVFTVSPL